MLTIFKGDDTGGQFGRTLNLTITTAEGTSLEGCRVEFIFDGIVRSFEGVESGDTVAIDYTHEETAAMQNGLRYAALRIIDPDGKVRTFDNTIVVRVTSTVREAYPGSDTASFVIGAGVAWEAVIGKPDTFPPALSARQQAAVDSGITAELVAQIGRGSGDVSSVNGKTGAVVLDAADVGTYDAEEINEKINQFAAHYLTALPDGMPFPSVAVLNSATQFYYAGELHDPDKNDYCFVENDELHDGASTRYMFVGEEGEGEWQYQYTVNETPLSFAQWAALNSGITAAKLAALATKTELAAKLDTTGGTVTGPLELSGAGDALQNRITLGEEMSSPGTVCITPYGIDTEATTAPYWEFAKNSDTGIARRADIRVTATTATALKDRDCAVVAFASGMTLTFAAATNGLRSFEVLLTGCEAGGSINFPSVVYRGESDALTLEAGDNHLVFAEYKAGEFFVTRHVANTITIG